MNRCQFHKHLLPILFALLIGAGLQPALAQVSTPDFVNYLYSEFYKRAGDPAGGQFWSDTITSGAATEEEVIEQFLSSAEFDETTAAMARLYYTALGRMPDSRGLAFWMVNFRGGVPLADIADLFVGSAEFMQNFGSELNDDEFVTQLYQNAVGREPTAAELQAASDAIATGATRGQIAVDVAELPETKAATADLIELQLAYQGLLGREPTEQEFDDNFGLSLDQLITSLTASSEYTLADPFQLQLLHAADMEGGANAVEDAPRFSAILNALREDYPNNTTVLSSGDGYIPGPLFSASDDESLRDLLGVEGPGRGDIVMLGAMGFQVLAFGNHEFDEGPDTVRSLIATEEADFDEDGIIDGIYPGTDFPYLSANLDFSAEVELADLVTADGQSADLLANSIARSATVTVAGETIGVVGATTPRLASISSTGDVIVLPENSDDLNALAAIIQSEIDQLTAAGIDKIVVLGHMQQLSIETALVPLLRDVDIMMGGGSDTILADATDRLRPGDEAADTYPILLTSASGEPVALINTDGQYRYVGRLVAQFTSNGVLLPGSIDPVESGAYATDDQGVVEVGGPEPDPTVAAIAEALGEVLIERDGNTFGNSSVYLEGRRANVRTEETNLGNLTADANLWVAQSFDPMTTISLKNGGGIRAEIGVVTFPPGSSDPEDVIFLPPPANDIAGKEEGQVSQFEIQNALRFNNDLTLLTLTAEQLVEVIEHAVAATEDGATPGQFGQVAGIRFSFDPSLEPNSRVRSLLVLDDNGAMEGGSADVIVQDGVLQGDPARTFRIVTLGFLAGGGDDYPYPDFPDTNQIDLVDQGLDAGDATFADPGTEQDALAEYLAAEFPDDMPFDAAETPPEQDMRIQNLSVRDDTVLTF